MKKKNKKEFLKKLENVLKKNLKKNNNFKIMLKFNF